MNMTSYQYTKAHCGDKTILRPSYLLAGISYTDKTFQIFILNQGLSHCMAADVLAPCAQLNAPLTPMRTNVTVRTMTLS